MTRVGSYTIALQGLEAETEEFSGLWEKSLLSASLSFHSPPSLTHEDQ